jgi:hypothetical protein
VALQHQAHVTEHEFGECGAEGGAIIIVNIATAGDDLIELIDILVVRTQYPNGFNVLPIVTSAGVRQQCGVVSFGIGIGIEKGS